MKKLPDLTPGHWYWIHPPTGDRVLARFTEGPPAVFLTVGDYGALQGFTAEACSRITPLLCASPRPLVKTLWAPVFDDTMDQDSRKACGVDFLNMQESRGDLDAPGEGVKVSCTVMREDIRKATRVYRRNLKD